MEILKENHIPMYETPEEAIKTYLYMYRYKRNLELLYETPAELPVTQSPPKNNLKAFIRRTLKEGKRVLTEADSKNFLKSYGIPTTTPFVVKTSNPRQPARTGSAIPSFSRSSPPTSCTGAKWAERPRSIARTGSGSAYEGLLERVREKAPEATIMAVTIEKMVENVHYQLILGAKKDTDFGSIILFGMGGMRTAAYKDVSFALPPLNQTLARLLMEETEIYKMLKGFLAKKPAELREIEQIIVSFSNLIVDFPEIAEMDVNPIVISNGKAVAANARIVLEEGESGQATHIPILSLRPIRPGM